MDYDVTISRYDLDFTFNISIIMASWFFTNLFFKQHLKSPSVKTYVYFNMFIFIQTYNTIKFRYIDFLFMFPLIKLWPNLLNTGQTGRPLLVLHIDTEQAATTCSTIILNLSRYKQ